MKKSIFAALAVMAFVISHAAPVMADDTATTKMENAGSDAKMDAKKSTRKMKRKGRKAMGTDSVGKDAKDGMNDAKDSMKNGAEKVDHKVNE